MTTWSHTIIDGKRLTESERLQLCAHEETTHDLSTRYPTLIRLPPSTPLASPSQAEMDARARRLSAFDPELVGNPGEAEERREELE